MEDNKLFRRRIRLLGVVTRVESSTRANGLDLTRRAFLSA